MGSVGWIVTDSSCRVRMGSRWWGWAGRVGGAQGGQQERCMAVMEYEALRPVGRSVSQV